MTNNNFKHLGLTNAQNDEVNTIINRAESMFARRLITEREKQFILFKNLNEFFNNDERLVFEVYTNYRVSK